MKSIFKAVTAAAFVLALGSTAQAAPVSWGVNATFGSATVSGTVSFDDATVAGFFDGIADPNDTHVNSDFVLSSAALGWANVLFSNVSFQPYFYIDNGDGPHADFSFDSNGFSIFLSDFNSAGLSNNQTGSFEDGTWSLDRGLQVPEPASLALVALGLLAIGARRRA